LSRRAPTAIAGSSDVVDRDVLPGDRDEIRRQAMLRALEMLRETAA